MRRRLLLLALALMLILALPGFGQESGELLFVLDATRSEIGRLDRETGGLSGRFQTPVFCRPEGACGMAFGGRSLFFVDATDPDGVIYEISPGEGAIWNGFPAPAGGVDGLAFADGSLYAVSFEEDAIYRIDPFDGRVLERIGVDADLVGGLAFGGGRLFASQIRPGQVVVVDPADGSVTGQFATPGSLPTGLAWLGEGLYVGDTEMEKVYRLNADTGAVEGEWELSGVRPAGLAAGQGIGAPPYVLRAEVVSEEQPSQEEVIFELRAGVYTQEGELLRHMEVGELRFAAASGQVVWLTDAVQPIAGGEASARLSMGIGVVAQVEARIPGLEPARLRLGATARTAAIALTLSRDGDDSTLVEVAARTFDAFGEPTVEDCTPVVFTVERGGGVLVGPSAVVPDSGRAQTMVRLLSSGADLIVSALQGKGAGESRLAVGRSGGGSDERLTVSGERVAGRDERPPEPPTQVRAESEGEQVVVSWQLSATEGKELWFPFGGRLGNRPLLEEYRVFRSLDGGFFAEVGRVETGTDRFVEPVPEETGTYKYKVLAGDGENFSETPVLPGSEADGARTVVVGETGGELPVDANGEGVLGLFGEDLEVGFDDFFLFADHFNFVVGDPEFDPLYDLDGSGAVDFDDFFIFSDYFGRRAVAR